MLAWFWPFRAQTPQRIILGLRQNLLTTTGISNREEHPFPEKFVPMSQLTLPDDTKASSFAQPSQGFPWLSLHPRRRRREVLPPLPSDPDPDLRKRPSRYLSTSCAEIVNGMGQKRA